METPDLLPILKDVAGGAAGTVAVVYFAWRKLAEICAETKKIAHRQTIILTKLGVHDDES